MKVPAPRVLAAAAFLLAACGSDREEERLDRLQGWCNGFVGQTLGQAEQTYQTAPFYWGRTLDTSCEPSWERLRGDADVCAYGDGDDYCRLYWEFWTNDRSQCDPIRGCRFVCMIHVPFSQIEAVDREAPICGSRWVQG